VGLYIYTILVSFVYTKGEDGWMDTTRTSSGSPSSCASSLGSSAALASSLALVVCSSAAGFSSYAESACVVGKKDDQNDDIFSWWGEVEGDVTVAVMGLMNVTRVERPLVRV
jgi:hypothetical protein